MSVNVQTDQTNNDIAAVLESRLHGLNQNAATELETLNSGTLEEWRVRYLGRKGLLAELMEAMASVPPEARAQIGLVANTVKTSLTAAFEKRSDRDRIESLQARLADEKIDVTLPGRRPHIGYSHPVKDTIEEITRIFADMGFSSVEGPEIEWERNNFTTMNIPADHPARDTMDTFYLDRARGILLRTHTSPMQARVMVSQQPPIRIIVPGPVYRRENEDATHLADFSQCEGLAVDTSITFADLKGTLAEFARRMFGAKTRFRPHHFQFTEPSAEMDVSCPVCSGKGCNVCKYEGWVELLGCGMVHPQVLRNVGYNPSHVAGFAFGIGIERAAFFKFGLPDVRLTYSSSLRWLSQRR